nr:CKLF-like MARVEL transmembrane domain-containing protein 6 [Anolis sagrei ordinatus]
MENGGRVYEATTVPAEQPPPGKAPRCCPGWALNRLEPPRLFLKVSQLLLSFLAFVCEEVVPECTNCGGLYFFEFVSCSAFLLCIAILIIYCTPLYKRTGKNITELLDLCVVIIILCFFALASFVFSATSDGTTIETVALVFGYLATLAFLADAVLSGYKKWKAKKEGQPENTANNLNPRENEPLNNQPA